MTDMTAQKDELSPCPFCGGDGVKCFNKTAGHPEMHWILCRTCHASPGDRQTEVEAIATWNHRTPTAPDSGMVEKLREVLKLCEQTIENHFSTGNLNGMPGIYAIKAVLSDARAALQPQDAPAKGGVEDEVCTVCFGENKAQGEFRCLQCNGSGLAKDNAWIKHHPLCSVHKGVRCDYDCARDYTPTKGDVEEIDFNTPPHMDPAFVAAWCQMEDEGYQYSENNVAKVHLGWLMAHRLQSTAELRAKLDEAKKAIRWAHDTLYEINPLNYDHDEISKLNDASVEVILGLAHILGERHGKQMNGGTISHYPPSSPAWRVGAVSEDMENLAERILNAAGSSLRHYTMQSTRGAILEAVRGAYMSGWKDGYEDALDTEKGEG